MTSKPIVSTMAIGDCSAIKIIKDANGQAVTIKLGNPKDLVHCISVFCYRWEDGPMEIEITDEATEEAAQHAKRETEAKPDEI